MSRDASALRPLSTSALKTLFHWSIIILGILLRLRQYLFNRSLWLDEAILAANFIHKDWLQLIQAPMDYTESMIAPVGFMVAAKTAITFLGNSDMVLRLYPFLCGILALPAFMKLSKYYVSQTSAVIALFIFAVCEPLVYYSSEFKQYSSDVLIAIALLLLVPYVEKRGPSTQSRIVLAIAGATLVWFSFPAALLLTVIGIYMIWQYKNEMNNITAILAISFIWLVSFWMHFRIVNGTEPYLTRAWVENYWMEKQAFMPASGAVFAWVPRAFEGLFSSLGHWQISWIPMTYFLLGSVIMIFSRNRQFAILAASFVLTVLISTTRLYPFHGRMILFLLPLLILVIAEGIAQLFAFQTPERWGFLAGTVTRIIFISAGIISLGVMINAKLVSHDEVKPVLEYVRTNKKDGDRIYLYYWTEPAFRYYASFYGFDYKDCKSITIAPIREVMTPIDFFRGVENIQIDKIENTTCILGVAGSATEAAAEFEKLKGSGRVWFVFSFFAGGDFVQQLDKIGTRLDELITFGASAYLYQL